MSILVDSDTRVLVQGITGRVGRAQTQYMLAEGTQIVAGVTPGKGGTTEQGVPVFDHVADAQAETHADLSLMFVPPAVAESAVDEALQARIRKLVLITEGIPVHATMRIRARVEAAGARLIGPATPGVISPGRCKVGIMPARFFEPGPVGVVSRSGTLSYEVSGQLSAAGIGQSTVVGLGADPVVGTDVTDLLRMFDEDSETRVVVLVGEVGGSQEERAARFASEQMNTPVVAYIAGRCAVPGVAMGHAGALVREGSGTVIDKVAALEAAGIRVAATPGGVVGLVQDVLGTEGG
ncbi:MAG: succinate--CoA ligase subunit alpha [Gemmatimonadetes bacterium]|jgi:succinyl-CoA synthetase alpha subunit|nr:succinate--CoA ligase subunit alpha [Gemmatimonadota bacterium]MBT7860344.1 succinate--CoA ligase subunit alpha [Gemmatimonadota bacterium]